RPQPLVAKMARCAFRHFLTNFNSRERTMTIKLLTRPMRRFLIDRLERLNEALLTLGQRLRESIAQIVGVQVGEAVQDAIEGMLNKKPTRTSSHRRFSQDRYHDPPYHRPDDRYEDFDEQGFWQDHEQNQEAQPEQRPSRWKTLLIGAVELATWTLRHRP